MTLKAVHYILLDEGRLQNSIAVWFYFEWKKSYMSISMC